MKIEINGKEFEIEANTKNIAELIAVFKLDLKSTAVAVNKEIIPKSRYNETLISENDSIDLIGIAPGG